MLVGSGALPQEAKEQMDQSCTHTVRNDIRPEARVSEKICFGPPIASPDKRGHLCSTKFTLVGKKKEKHASFHTSWSLFFSSPGESKWKKKKRNSFLFSFRCTSRTLINANGIHAFRQECSQPQD